jgi:hypothetical protein
MATVEPQLSVDAHIQQVTADRSMASLPKALQLAMLDALSPMQAGFLLFLGGLMVLCLAVYVVGAVSLTVARRGKRAVPAE